MLSGAAVVILLLGGFLAVRFHSGSDRGDRLASADQLDSFERAEADRRAEAAAADRSAVRIEPSPSDSPSGAPSSPAPTPSSSPSAKPSTKPRSSPAAVAPAKVSSSGTCGVSYYDTGSTTANGESFDPDGLTAAHKTFKFGTKVRVTNPANDKSVVVRINDRGPFVSGRCLDLARGAFVQISSVNAGVINARYEVLA